MDIMDLATEPFRNRYIQRSKMWPTQPQHYYYTYQRSETCLLIQKFRLFVFRLEPNHNELSVAK
ncbi:hypothetical protein AVEN_58772-1, partial [Araneus ventricosus]